MLTNSPLINNYDNNQIGSAVDLENEYKWTLTSRYSPIRSLMASLTAFVLAVPFMLLPSFIQPLFSCKTTPLPPTLISIEDRSDGLRYLTGLRGFASTVVFIYRMSN